MAHPKRYTLLIFAAIGLIALGVSARLYQLTRIKFDIDLMEDGLAPIKEHLHGAARIGYVTDIPSDGLYNETAFVLAPVVLVKNAAKDTVLYVQVKGLQPKAFPQYQPIATGDNEHYQFILFQKNK